MKPTAKGVGVGAVVGGWMVYLQDIVAWGIHGAVANDWTGFPEQAAVSLLMAAFTFAVYRAWPASDRTPPEPKL
jgi:glucose uptake protein GlcU